MGPSLPFLKTAVSNTPILIFKNSTRLSELEVQNANTEQIWCQLFDTNVAANVKVNVTFTANATTDVLTSAAHGLSNGWKMKLFNTGGALPAGLLPDTFYYVVNATTNTFQLAARVNGAPIDFTDAGSGTNSYSTFFKRSIIAPAGDGTSWGAVTKEWPKDGLLFHDGLCLMLSKTSPTGSTAPSTACLVQGAII